MLFFDLTEKCMCMKFEMCHYTRPSCQVLTAAYEFKVWVWVECIYFESRECTYIPKMSPVPFNHMKVHPSMNWFWGEDHMRYVDYPFKGMREYAEYCKLRPFGT
jgi:hypothetical protein